MFISACSGQWINYSFQKNECSLISSSFISELLTMKSILLIAVFCASASFCFSQTTERPDSTKKMQTVETACGQCKLGLPGKSCDLAVRINGKAYFVDGTDIDSHGDAHAKDGFCNSVRKAQVQGEVVNDRFRVSYFKLMPSGERRP